MPNVVKARLKHGSHIWGLMFIPSLTVSTLATNNSLVILLAIAALQIVLILALPGTSPALSNISRDEVGAAACVNREHLDALFRASTDQADARPLAALVLQIDDADRLRTLHGPEQLHQIMAALQARLAYSLRAQDSFCALNGEGFAIALMGQKGKPFDTVVGIAQRLQTTLSDRYELADIHLHVTVSIGFCISGRAAQLNGLSQIEAASKAAQKAKNSGPMGLNSYSVVDFPTTISSDSIDSLKKALDNGEIRAYFQPQVRTDTGEVSGLEALARWEHPKRGLLPPGEFLPQIEASGLSSKLARCMLIDSLRLVSELDKEQAFVPSVAVNLSSEELRNPRLADEVAWELDRFDLPPERLTLEILETVVSQSDDDIAVKTIARLSTMGCNIDLDDFGTGYASLAHIRRFAVNRIKIDRSFVTHMAEDLDHQRMVAAILSMADQLGLTTLAEGVECAEEQIMLAQMGCEHLQGFGIARPMRPEDLQTWLQAHQAALEAGEPWCEDATHPSAALG